MKKILLVFLIISSNLVFTQNSEKKYNPLAFKIGTGFSLQGRGDYMTMNFENSLEYFIKSITSVSLDYTTASVKSIYTRHWDLYKMNKLDLVLHRNIRSWKKNKFRLGLGLAYIDVSNLRVNEGQYNNNIWYNFDYTEFNTLGIIYSVDFQRDLSERLFFDCRIFQNLYFSEISTGLSLRVGYKLIK